MRTSKPLRNAFSSLQTSLPSRRWSPLIEPLNTTSAHRLSQSLTSFLPSSWVPQVPVLSSRSSTLPPGYHLVYFNPVLGPEDLLPDGTDRKHSPGDPFVRRMWAGGNVRYREPGKGVRLDGGAGVCLERIRDVAVKGKEGQEKIFVGIERRIGRAEIDGDGKLVESEDQTVERLWSEKEEDFADAEMIERRNIVFMRERTPEELKEALKLVDAPRNPNAKKCNKNSLQSISSRFRN
jgi:hydroxyacyl-ACP dehydratase HTD2-like protein with hotdog domain